MTSVMKANRFLRSQRQHGAPPFGRRNEGRIASVMKCCAEKTRAPKPTTRWTTPFSFLWVVDFAARSAIVCQRGMISTKDHSQPGQNVGQRYLVSISFRGKAIAL